MSTGNTGKEKLRESMSALMDDEASEFEFRRILKECESNPELKAKWERFHMLSAVMKGELDSSGFNVLKAGAGNSEVKRPDLLSRINAELDGKSQSESSFASLDDSKEQSGNGNQSQVFGRLGQGAIAASVAAIVLVASGVLNPSTSQESEFADLQLVDQSGISEDRVLEFDDAYSPSQFSRVPQLGTEFASTDMLDEEAARVRLRQAVFQEFVGEPQESVELPVNFNVIIERE
ncbi:MAG: sigma-E factor negative regulatory protein [Pseudohongiellaceae bacterium]|jgi:negative regulator of sigma E activity